jgi:uncharacterized membrane protein YphA (DoxX/SURF4 family)
MAMSGTAMKDLLFPTWNVRAVMLVRVAVGLIFLTQGILKYIDPQTGVLRFIKIGFPYPDFTAHFVGTFEITCGSLVLVGLLTRIASVPLLIVIVTAIATTKIPELWHPNQGFWFMVSDARTDFAMTMSLLFLVSVGAGAWSLDSWILALVHHMPQLTAAEKAQLRSGAQEERGQHKGEA